MSTETQYLFTLITHEIIKIQPQLTLENINKINELILEYGNACREEAMGRNMK